MYGPYCRAIALRILDSEEDAEECLADVWLRVWNAVFCNIFPGLSLRPLYTKTGGPSYGWSSCYTIKDQMLLSSTYSSRTALGSAAGFAAAGAGAALGSS